MADILVQNIPDRVVKYFEVLAAQHGKLIVS